MFNTELIVIDETGIENNVMERAGKILKEGGLVAFPTETVYGLGGDGLNKESAKKIYAAKGRPSDNPLIIHISKFEDLGKIVKSIPEEVERLAEAFWPGPLTMILPKSEQVPYETTGGLDTVAVRMPSHPVALAFIEASGGYVAAPSANTSGRPSPTLAKHVMEDMQGKIEMILDGGSVEIGLESTIVDLSCEVPTILRPGYVTKDMLEKVLGEVALDQTTLDLNSQEIPKAPGMKYKHYAPQGELTIVTGESKNVIAKINQLTKEAYKRNDKVGVIATEETQSQYCAKIVKSVGKRRAEEEIARHLYAILREFDEEQVEVIYSESFEGSEMGQAIMNRLLKAAGHKMIKC